MVDSGTVQGDLSKYINHMDNCKAKFEGLEPNWKGPSRTGLLASVNSFLDEAKCVNGQMFNLSSICNAYVEYDSLREECLNLEKLIAQHEGCTGCGPDRDEGGHDVDHAGIIAHCKKKIDDNVARMTTLVNSSNDKVASIKSVTLSPVDISIPVFDFSSKSSTQV